MITRPGLQTKWGLCIEMMVGIHCVRSSPGFVITARALALAGDRGSRILYLTENIYFNYYTSVV